MRGYEFKKDTYVLLDDEDFERARIESSTVLNIGKFVDAATIDPIYFDASYYVGPDGDSAAGRVRGAAAGDGEGAAARRCRGW